MADILPSVTETIALTSLRSFLLTVVGCEVIRGQNNRTAMPSGDFIVMTPTSLMPLATPVDAYTSTTRKVTRSTQMKIQLDFYGALSADRSVTVSTLLRDGVATDFFTGLGYDMQILYAGDSQQIPLITGEEQYLERWTFDAVLQINPALSLTAQTANTLTVGIINVDATYPA
jgi:hypothetical protein